MGPSLIEALSEALRRFLSEIEARVRGRREV